MAVSLNDIIETGDARPPRTVLYGVEGIGKTTFGAQAPSPIFIRTEDGTSAVKVQAFPLAKSYDDVIGAITVLAGEDHDFQTVVLDSIDWTETLIKAQVARDNGMAEFDVQSKALGYGKGWMAVADYWRRILDGFDYLRDERGMQVILLGHAQVKRYDDPMSDAYDRYQLDLNKESASVIVEWADVVGFANYRVSTKTETVGINSKKTRGLGDGARLLYTQEKPAFKAKSRWRLPPEMALDYGAFATALSDAMSATA